MTIVIFILVLVALIVVHEFGHFVVAKWSGMRVDEFGLGYPPKALTLAKKGGTEYTLNWLPFGGFVRIWGEDEFAVREEKGDAHRAFFAKPKWQQAAVLLAGIFMNLLFAYVLITITLFIGAPESLSKDEAAHSVDAALTITDLVPHSAAADAGVLPGDIVTSASYGASTFSGIDPDTFTAFVAADRTQQPITLHLKRANEDKVLTVTPHIGTIVADPGRPALGVAIGAVGTVRTPFWQAPIEGGVVTWELIKATAVGLYHFFGGIFTFKADLSQVSGPVGIAKAVGQASQTGAAALMTITALISINLALINVIPIPALDGGRLLFVMIEAITRKPIKPVVAQTMNTVSFALLILLMVVITAHDVLKLVS
jgi:regulator of sigma E protease